MSKHPCKQETHSPQVKKKLSSVFDLSDFGFICTGVTVSNIVIKLKETFDIIWVVY